MDNIWLAIKDDSSNGPVLWAADDTLRRVQAPAVGRERKGG